MDVLGSVGSVLRNFSLTQNNMQKDVRALASGLRVQSAADDPSGLAISQSLQSKVNGLQQSVQNVQTANNLLQVADGALSSVQQILQRIRSLTVEARSDINSDEQLSNIQNEIGQLLLEVNRISQNTNFNGLKLLDGTYAPPSQTNTQVYGATQLTSYVLTPSGQNGSSSVVTPWVDSEGNTTNQLVVPLAQGVSGPQNFTPATLIFQVVGWDSVDAVDPQSGPIGGPGAYVQVTAYSNNPNFGGAPVSTWVNAVPANTPLLAIGITTPAVQGGQNTSPFLQELMDFDLGPITQQDVGATATFITTAQNTNSTQGRELQVNDGGQEGTTVGMYLPDVSTQVLNISDISVMRPQTVDYYTDTVTGESSTNLVTAGDAENRTDGAIGLITTFRAQIGAQMVALNEDSNNDNTSVVNLTASISSITDASVGQTMTDFTKNQILTQIGQQVISSTQTNAKQLTAMLFASI